MKLPLCHSLVLLVSNAAFTEAKIEAGIEVKCVGQETNTGEEKAFWQQVQTSTTICTRSLQLTNGIKMKCLPRNKSGVN